MKTIKTLLVALLVLALLAGPVALAEDIEAYTLTLSNPVAYMNGAAIGNLKGLTVEGSLANLENSKLLRLRVLGGESIAAEGYASFDGRRLVLGADGLSSLYSVPLEKLGMNDSFAQLAMLSELFSESTLNEFMTVISTAANEYMATVMSTQVDEGVQNIDFATGALDMQGYSYTISTDALQKFFNDISGGLQAIPVIKQLLVANAPALSTRYNDEKVAADDIFANMNDVQFTLWKADSGEIRLVMKYSLTESGKRVDFILNEDAYTDTDGAFQIVATATGFSGDEEIIRVKENMTMAETGNGIVVEFSATGSALTDGDWEEYANMSFTFHPQGYTEANPDRSTFELAASVTTDGKENTLTINGYFAPKGGNYAHDEFYASLFCGNAEENNAFEILTQSQHADGEEYYGAQVSVSENDEYQSMYFTYQGKYTDNAYGGEDHSGSLALGFAQGDDMNVEGTLDVAFTHGTIDSGELPDMSGETVNALAMGEKEADLFNTEGQALLYKALGLLAGGVPGFSALMSNINI